MNEIKESKYGDRLARLYLIQALYQYHITNHSLLYIKRIFIENNQGKFQFEPAWDHFANMLTLYTDKESILDKQLLIFLKENTPLLNRIIIKLALCEIIYLKKRTSYIIQEYKIQAYSFGSINSPKLLHKVVKSYLAHVDLM